MSVATTTYTAIHCIGHLILLWNTTIEVCSANRHRDTSADTALNSREVLREFLSIT